MFKRQMQFYVFITALLATLPSYAQVEVAVKPTHSIISGKIVRFLPLLLIMKDDTFTNLPKEKGEITQTLLLIQPFNARFRGKTQVKRLSLEVSGQYTEGSSFDENVCITTTEASLLLTRLDDVQRITKRWEKLKDNISEDEKERSVVFNPHSDI